MVPGAEGAGVGGGVMNRKAVAKELVAVAEMLAESGDVEYMAAEDEVETLQARLLARLGQAKARKLRQYGVELKPTDTVEALARAWATVILAG